MTADDQAPAGDTESGGSADGRPVEQADTTPTVHEEQPPPLDAPPPQPDAADDLKPGEAILMGYDLLTYVLALGGVPGREITNVEMAWQAWNCAEIAKKEGAPSLYVDHLKNALGYTMRFFCAPILERAAATAASDEERAKFTEAARHCLLAAGAWNADPDLRNRNFLVYRGEPRELHG